MRTITSSTRPPMSSQRKGRLVPVDRRARPCVFRQLSMVAALTAIAATAVPSTASAFTVTTTVADMPMSLKVDGFASAYYSFVLQDPATAVSNARLFASRHNSITVSGASLGFELSYGGAFVKVAPWFGLTPTTIYSGEPSFDGVAGVGPSDASIWRYLREANGGFTIDNLTIDAGLFVSAIGIEGIAEKDNWLWSSSWLNYIFPFYHFGARAHYTTDSGHTLGLWVVNSYLGGALDTNDAKSIIVTAAGPIGEGRWQVLYFGGIERADDLLLDKAWLHHLDFWLTVPVADGVDIAVQADFGIEPNQFGVAWFVGGAAYLKVTLSDYVYVAVRGEVFTEQAAEDGNLQSPLIFGLPEWVAEGSIALNVQPVEHTAIRLEYRHDQASDPLFFGDAANPSQESQDAVTLGLTVWL